MPSDALRRRYDVLKGFESFLKDIKWNRGCVGEKQDTIFAMSAQNMSLNGRYSALALLERRQRGTVTYSCWQHTSTRRHDTLVLAGHVGAFMLLTYRTWKCYRYLFIVIEKVGEHHANVVVTDTRHAALALSSWCRTLLFLRCYVTLTRA